MKTHDPPGWRELIEQLLARYGDGQTVEDVLVVELSGRALLTTADGRLSISRGAMQSVAAYETRFAALGSAGYSWINVSYYGNLGESALVAVELPSEAVGERRGARPSINLSGPPRKVVDQGGDARALVAIARVESGESRDG